ncbi:META domain-containing protein [Ruegeria marina]|uniref:Heat shock protein HslJ n=1 Tax=Ruegeria marina TaxID=639004 RepID=A0A1G7BIU7_9RHOB|nr:META domain-containing protein [Ruegeria marina]SDE26979.1 heat shock protein HslJ [Ruegeria marina]
MLRAAWLLPVLSLSFCAKDETVAAYGAGGRTWVLQSIDGLVFHATATLGFPETGLVAGQGPCNGFSGHLDVPYPWFEIQGLAATRRACPELEAEGVFFAALMAMEQAEVAGDVLILRNEAGHEMLFTAAY